MIKSLSRWAITIGAILLVWQLAGNAVTVRLFVSQPSLMAQYVSLHAYEIGRSALYTALESSVGLTAAVLFSFSFGLCAVYFPRLANLFYPWLVTSQVIPFVCLAPIVIVVFGFGISGKIFLSALMAFFPVVTSILTGMREVPSPPLEMMRMMDARKSMIIRHVFIPYGLPHFFSGLRVAAPFAVAGAIVAEFNGADWGVGKDIFVAAKRLEPELMMFGVISGVIISTVLYSLTIFAENRLGEWYRGNSR